VGIPVKEGWNLISFPVVPADQRIPEVLASVAGLYSAVMGFNGGGLSYYPSLPDEFNTLRLLQPYQGYWIKMQSEGVLVISGYPAASETPLALKPGWNLVGYLSPRVLPVAEALASVEGQYDAVLGYDGGGLSFYPYLPYEFNTLTAMRPGRGYWVRMKAWGSLVYPQ